MLIEQVDPVVKKTLQTIEAMVRYQEKSASELAEKSKKDSGFSRFVLISLSGSAIVLGILIAVLISRSITRPIRRVAEGLTSGADRWLPPRRNWRPLLRNLRKDLPSRRRLLRKPALPLKRWPP